MNDYIKKISILTTFIGCWAYAYADPVNIITTQSKTAAAAINKDKDKDEDVKKTVLGIMSYTRWIPPPTPVNFCIVAAKHAAALEHLDSLAPNIANTTPSNTATAENRIVISKPDYDAAKLSAQCDVIYFGNISPADQQKVIATRQNHPILTISEDNDCEIGSSFCLQTTSSPITFLVNLDSLTRSGVRVDPNVLLLGKKRTSP